MVTANPVAVAAVKGLGVSIFRERLWASNPSQNAAIDAMPGLRVFGYPGVLGESESTVRGRIASIAKSARAGQFAAFCGPNEVNSSGGSQWAADTLLFQSWIWDEVVNVQAANWPGTRPRVVGGVLKYFVANLDADIAAFAGASRDSGKHMADYSDLGDFHYYSWGDGGPGARVSGVDSNGNRPAGLGTGQVSVEKFQLQRARQIYGSATFPMCHSEWGFTTFSQTTEAQASPVTVETYLRDYLLGIRWSILYEAIDEKPNVGGSEGSFGIYNVTSGAKPAYTALKALFGYTGSASFSGIGWIEPLAGTNPDCGVVVFSKSGGWDVYLLREAQTSVDFVTGPGFEVNGKSATTTDAAGNKHYTISLASSMVTLSVSASTDGGAFAPNWIEV